MTGTACRAKTARGHLARLVGTLAVLAGLAVVVGLHCSAAMSANMPANMADGMATHAGMATVIPMSQGMSSRDAETACDPPTASERTAPVAASVLGAVCLAPVPAGTDSSSPNGVDHVLVVCLAFLIAVVAVAAMVRPGEVWYVDLKPRIARMVSDRAIAPRAPSLAELCVLRT